MSTTVNPTEANPTPLPQVAPARPPMPWSVRVSRGLGMLLAFVAAGALFYASQQTFWEMRLRAPQYPDGLKLQIYLDRIEGDVEEVNILNHYIGVSKIDEGAKLERAIGIPAAILLSASLLLAPFAGRKKFFVLAIPAIGFPAGFILDLAYWMNRLSTHLDPKAPIKMKPFSFALSGESKIAQFSSETSFSVGFGIACAVAIGALLAVVLREMIACRRCPHAKTCGMVCKGALPWPTRS